MDTVQLQFFRHRYARMNDDELALLVATRRHALSDVQARHGLTRNGTPRRAVTSFWTTRTLPPRAAHVERWAASEPSSSTTGS
jgi:hypothetical protein